MQSQIAVHIIYSGAVQLECSRCLNTFLYPVAGDFHVILQDKSGDKKNTDDDDDDFSDFTFDNATDEMDIRDAIYDDVVTALPMKPLCADSCPGIAPMYVAAAEETAQDTASETVDVRWDALKKLKKQL